MCLGATIKAAAADRLPAACAHHEVPTVSWIKRSSARQHEHPAFKATDRPHLPDCFNGGDSGPVYWHWIAGIGNTGSDPYWVLSDTRNEVKGKPHRVSMIKVGNRRVEIWQFPDYPAGGQFGGHIAAITRSGPYLAIASIHGDNADADARMVVALARKADAAR